MSALRSLAWLATGLLAIILLTQPVSVQAQLALSLSAIGALLIIWRIRGALARQLFLTLAAFCVLRYVYWRVSFTLPAISDPVGFSFGMVLLAAELYCVAFLIASLIVNADPVTRKPLKRPSDEELPTVDVLIPTYNEEEYILATTLAAALSMDYPREKLNVYLLDDGGTDQKLSDPDPVKRESAHMRRATLMALADRMGAHYLTRARNEHAKAGNLNNGLVHSSGDVVVVFDADHAPFRAFLQETVGYFIDDPRIFLVQTPHVFLNPDPIERNLRTFKNMPSENEMFYSITQRGLDKWDAAFFCGSAAVLRREALEEAGGFAGVTITEDCETAFELHAKGWSSVFVDKPLIAGLQPDTFASFIGQRMRWCQGMLQILLLKNPLFKSGLRPIQKVGYLSSMTFWLFPFPRLVFMLAPLTFILFDVKIFVSNVDEAIAYTLTYMIVGVMLQNYLFGVVRWPFVSELYEYCQGVYLLRAIASVIVNPRKPTFNVTAKGQALDEDRLSELAWPFFALYGLIFAASVVAAWRYVNDPGAGNLMLIVGLWNTFNLAMAGVALGAVAERRETDRHPRLGVDRRGALEIDGRETPVAIVNVSAGGCALAKRKNGPALPVIAERVAARLFIEPIGDLAGAQGLPVVALPGSGRDEGAIGCEFAMMQPEDYFALADLMYGDSDALPRFLASRRRHKNVFVGAAQFLWWGVTEPLRAFAYALKRARPALRESSEPSPAPRASTLWLRRFSAMAADAEIVEPAAPVFQQHVATKVKSA